MTAPIARSSLTKAVVDHLIATLEPGVLVGRGSAPRDGGWLAGQPGVSTFKPYVTVKAGVATQRETEVLGVRRALHSWSCGYRLSYASHRESFADDTADLGRAAISTMSGDLLLDGVTWTIQKIDFPRLGATGPNNSTDPPFWDVTDDVSLWLSRVLTA